MSTDSQITLPDGRKLTYTEFGKPDGQPLMYFHGSPSSRLEPLLIGNDVLSSLGLRVISADRPGIGGSDSQPNRGFADWTEDVTALADALRLDKFAVLGNSGGAPYCAACAVKIPERLSSAVIVSGGWRMNWPEAREGLPLPNRLVSVFSQRAPLLLGLMLKAMAGSAEIDEAKELPKWKNRVPPPDYQALAQPGRLTALNQMMLETFRQGTKGAGWDLQLYVREFDFSLDELKFPITWFHGELDRNSPIALARKVAGLAPSIRLITFANDAHFSTLHNHFDEIRKAIR